MTKDDVEKGKLVINIETNTRAKSDILGVVEKSVIPLLREAANRSIIPQIDQNFPSFKDPYHEAVISLDSQEQIALSHSQKWSNGEIIRKSKIIDLSDYRLDFTEKSLQDHFGKHDKPRIRISSFRGMDKFITAKKLFDGAPEKFHFRKIENSHRRYQISENKEFNIVVEVYIKRKNWIVVEELKFLTNCGSENDDIF